MTWLWIMLYMGFENDRYLTAKYSKKRIFRSVVFLWFKKESYNSYTNLSLTVYQCVYDNNFYTAY